MISNLNPAAKLLAEIGAYFGEPVPITVEDLKLLSVDHDEPDPELDAAGLAKAAADIAGYLTDGPAVKGTQQEGVPPSKFDRQVLNYFGRGHGV